MEPDLKKKKYKNIISWLGRMFIKCYSITECTIRKAQGKGSDTSLLKDVREIWINKRREITYYLDLTDCSHVLYKYCIIMMIRLLFLISRPLWLYSCHDWCCVTIEFLSCLILAFPLEEDKENIYLAGLPVHFPLLCLSTSLYLIIIKVPLYYITT